MAKGQASKEQFFNKILEVFPGSFMYNGNKEIRVPFEENGETIQLKIAATCAKTPVTPDGSVMPTSDEGIDFAAAAQENSKAAPAEITQEEKDNVASLLASLGL